MFSLTEHKPPSIHPDYQTNCFTYIFISILSAGNNYICCSLTGAVERGGGGRGVSALNIFNNFVYLIQFNARATDCPTNVGFPPSRLLMRSVSVRRKTLRPPALQSPRLLGQVLLLLSRIRKVTCVVNCKTIIFNF